MIITNYKFKIENYSRPLLEADSRRKVSYLLCSSKILTLKFKILLGFNIQTLNSQFVI